MAILKALRDMGLTAPDARDWVERSPTPIRRREADDGQARIEAALRLWHDARDPRGTIVERYLAARGLALPPSAANVIRFHPRCPVRAAVAPTMVCLFRDIGTDDSVGIHRTPLEPSGLDRDRSVPKMMLGRAAGAAVKLSADDDVTMGLHIAEGIESGLALLAFGLSPAWSLGSASAIAAFPVLPGIEALTIAVDHDAIGAGDRAAESCARRWLAAGREVRLMRAHAPGEDAADIAMRIA